MTSNVSGNYGTQHASSAVPPPLPSRRANRSAIILEQPLNFPPENVLNPTATAQPEEVSQPAAPKKSLKDRFKELNENGVKASAKKLGNKIQTKANEKFEKGLNKLDEFAHKADEKAHKLQVKTAEWVEKKQAVQRSAQFREANLEMLKIMVDIRPGNMLFAQVDPAVAKKEQKKMIKYFDKNQDIDFRTNAINFINMRYSKRGDESTFPAIVCAIRKNFKGIERHVTDLAAIADRRFTRLSPERKVQYLVREVVHLATHNKSAFMFMDKLIETISKANNNNKDLHTLLNSFPEAVNIFYPDSDDYPKMTIDPSKISHKGAYSYKQIEKAMIPNPDYYTHAIPIVAALIETYHANRALILEKVTEAVGKSQS